MSSNQVSVKIHPATKKLLHQCKNEFTRHHPEFNGKHISMNHIIHQIAVFYLKSP